MQTRDFHFDLPAELIAQAPLQERSASRLLVFDPVSSHIEDDVFSSLADRLTPNDLLVFNDSRVIPARLFGRKASGGRIEILIERLLEGNRVLAHVRASKSPKPATMLHLEDETEVEVVAREDSLFLLDFKTQAPLLEVLERLGHMPLPPYIKRLDAPEDRARYQTVYARHPGSVAAPTAGLHFDDNLLSRLRDRGVAMTHITLHVGAGTFLPVRVQDPAEHRMHAEYVNVGAQACAKINACHERGGRVIAVGTTAVRSLETAAREGALEPFSGETRLFIRPGFDFKVVDALITNFHLPESTLLMLVSAFGGYPQVMRIYEHAIANKYRFFSYGDAMFITRRHEI